jgi:3,4-dihydroxy 2-butanone 4-phosphate synthase/GTP cyclohydrolase II
MVAANPVLREQSLLTAHGKVSTRLYRDEAGRVAMAIWVGDLGGSEAVLTRVHSSCFTSEGICGMDCDCVQQLDLAIDLICKAGRGIVFYLLQEGRGAGLSNKARDRSIVQQSGGRIDTYQAYAQLGLPPDPRNYDVIKPMVEDLGITAPLTLMTNNPEKIAQLSASGLSVVPIEHVRGFSRYNAQYIQAKAAFGHSMLSPEMSAATLPPLSVSFLEHPPRFGRWVWAATYFLPINVGGGPAWFSASSYVDEITGHDRMLLSFRSRAVPGVRHVFREELEARISGSGVETQRYRQALIEIVQRGAGTVLAIPSDPALILGTEGPTAADDRALLDADSAHRGVELHDEVA